MFALPISLYYQYTYCVVEVFRRKGWHPQFDEPREGAFQLLQYPEQRYILRFLVLENEVRVHLLTTFWKQFLEISS